MKEAVREAEKNAHDNFSGGFPFGAVIVFKGEIVGRGRNQVIMNNDPTAHADIQAIRNACANLNINDLTGCVLYTTCYPCPMCITAARCAGIKKVFFGNAHDDVTKIGFNDDIFHDALINIILGEESGEHSEIMELLQIGSDIAITTLQMFANKQTKIY